jgi:hypothetical protein
MKLKKSKSVKADKKQEISVSASSRPVGRPRSKNPRKSSHIPLRADEHKKLSRAARLLGLPYATWARMTLVIVADWPEDKQPIRGFGPASVSGPASKGSLPFMRRITAEGEERSYDGGKTWGREVSK